jgi:hypothetical protein
MGNGKRFVKCLDLCDSCELWAMPFRPACCMGAVLWIHFEKYRRLWDFCVYLRVLHFARWRRSPVGPECQCVGETRPGTGVLRFEANHLLEVSDRPIQIAGV